MATPTTLPATFVAGNVLTAAQMNNLRGAFRILQVVSATKTDTFTTTSTTFTDVTGLSVSITPSATSSKILVLASISGSSNITIANGGARLVRDSTAIMVGDAAGSRSPGFQIEPSGAALIANLATSVLDSPATTSALTYKWQVKSATAGTFFVNRSQNDTDAVYVFRSASSITVMEISA